MENEIQTASLERSYTPFGVWGRLHVPGFTLCTLERPWEENRVRKSCIPPGVYTCQRIKSPKFGDTFEILDVPKRSHILFHPLNDISESEGCIGVAQVYDIRDNKLKIVNSRKGFSEFMSAFHKQKRFQLVISSYSPAYP